jgi:hypothetical protein
MCVVRDIPVSRRLACDMALIYTRKISKHMHAAEIWTKTGDAFHKVTLPGDIRFSDKGSAVSFGRKIASHVWGRIPELGVAGRGDKVVETIFGKHVWDRHGAEEVRLTTRDMVGFKQHRWRFGFEGTYADEDLRKVFARTRLERYAHDRDEMKQRTRWEGANRNVAAKVWNVAARSLEDRARVCRLLWDKRLTKGRAHEWKCVQEEDARCEVCGVLEDTEHIIMECRKMGRVMTRCKAMTEMEVACKNLRAQCGTRLRQALGEELVGPDGLMLWLAMPTRAQMAKLHELGAADAHLVTVLRPLTIAVEKFFEGDLLEGTHLTQSSGSIREEEALGRKMKEWCAKARDEGNKPTSKVARGEGKGPEAKYRSAFRAIGRVVEVRGDGNCLYRAVAVAEGQAEGDHAQWRAKLASFYQLHREECQAEDPTLELRRCEVSEESTWAHEFDVKSMAEVLGKTIQVWVYNECQIRGRYEHVPTRYRHLGQKIALIHKNENHFDALLICPGVNDDVHPVNDTFTHRRCASGSETAQPGKEEEEVDVTVGKQTSSVMGGKKKSKKIVFTHRTYEQMLRGSYEARYMKFMAVVSKLGWGHPWVFDNAGTGFFEAVAMTLGRNPQDRSGIQAAALLHLTANSAQWRQYFKHPKDLEAYIATRQKGSTTPDATMVAATAWAEGIRIQLGVYSVKAGEIAVHEPYGPPAAVVSIRVVQWDKTFVLMRNTAVGEIADDEDESWPAREAAFSKVVGQYGRVVRVTPDWQCGYRAITVLTVGGEEHTPEVRKLFLTEMKKVLGIRGTLRAKQLDSEKETLNEEDWRFMARVAQRTIRMIAYSSSGEEEVKMYHAGENAPRVTMARWTDENLYVAVAEEAVPAARGMHEEVSQEKESEGGHEGTRGQGEGRITRSGVSTRRRLYVTVVEDEMHATSGVHQERIQGAARGKMTEAGQGEAQDEGGDHVSSQADRTGRLRRVDDPIGHGIAVQEMAQVSKEIRDDQTVAPQSVDLGRRRWRGAEDITGPSMSSHEAALISKKHRAAMAIETEAVMETSDPRAVMDGRGCDTLSEGSDEPTAWQETAAVRDDRYAYVEWEFGAGSDDQLDWGQREDLLRVTEDEELEVGGLETAGKDDLETSYDVSRRKATRLRRARKRGGERRKRVRESQEKASREVSTMTADAEVHEPKEGDTQTGVDRGPGSPRKESLAQARAEEEGRARHSSPLRKKKKKGQEMEVPPQPEHERTDTTGRRRSSGHSPVVHDLYDVSQEERETRQRWESDGDRLEVGMLEERMRSIRGRCRSEREVWRHMMDEEGVVWVRRDVRDERWYNTPARGYCGYIAMWDTWRRQHGLRLSCTLGDEFEVEFAGWLKRFRMWFAPETIPWRVIGAVLTHLIIHPKGLLPREMWFDRLWLEGVQLDCRLHIWVGGEGPTATLAMTTDEQRFVRGFEGVAGSRLDSVGRHDHSIIWAGDHFFIVNEPCVMSSLGLVDAFRSLVRTTWEIQNREETCRDETGAGGADVGELDMGGVVGIATEAGGTGRMPSPCLLPSGNDDAYVEEEVAARTSGEDEAARMDLLPRCGEALPREGSEDSLLERRA